MKIDVIDKKENPFLKRADLILTVDHAGKATPKKDELAKMIADKLKSVPEKVEIVYIFTESGLSKSKVKARVWKEKVPVKKVKKEKVEKPKEETKPEEKKKEKPKEVKPEEEKKPEKEGEKK